MFKPNLRPPVHFSALFFVIVAVIAAAPGLAQQSVSATTTEPRIVDDKLREGEHIESRLEWFYESRRAGTSSDTEMARLRAEGVVATRNALKLQRLLRDNGSLFQNNFWVSKGPSPSNFGGWTFGPVAGRVSSLDVDWASGALYLGTASGGLWKSTNDGLSWTPLFDSAGTMTIGTVEIDPNDPNVIWVGTGENNQGCESYFGIGLLRSADGGQTWETRNGSGSQSLESLSSFANVVVDPRDSNYLVTGGRIRGCENGSESDGGLYTSSDAGATWTQRLFVRVYEIAQDPTVLDTMWAATADGVYKSIDKGQNWTLQTSSGLPNGSTERTELAISPSDSNTVYALFQSPRSLWRTTDGGVSWEQRSTDTNACDGQCSYNMVLRVHPTDPDIVVRGTIRIWRSTDGGLTWVDQSNGWGASQKVHQDMHVLVMDPGNPDAYYAGGDGGLWKTENNGSSFVNKNGNLNITQFYAIGVKEDDTETICGGSQDNSSLARTTTDTWNLQTVTGDGFVCHFDSLDPNYAYITSYPYGGNPSVYRSTSGVFGSFSRITGDGSGIESGDSINWVTPYLLDPRSPSTLYLGTSRVWRSDDHGTSWTHVGPQSLTGNSGSLKALEINRSYPDYLYTGSLSGKLWRTIDGGSTWEDLSAGLPGRSINDIAADPTNPDRGFAVVGGFGTAHLWEWNQGAGWVERGTDLPNVPANSVLMLTATDILVGTDTGTFRSIDGGQTFAPYMDGLPEGTVVTDLKYNPAQSVVTAGTYGRGAWQASVDSFGPIMIYDSVELPMTEVDGDGDGQPEPGETWSVRPVLRNAGNEAALEVNAQLAAASPGIHFVGGASRSFGEIAPGAAAMPLTAFEFWIDPSFACGLTATFDVVSITTSNPGDSHVDRPAAFEVLVQGGTGPPNYTSLVDETFDGATPDWSHRVGTFVCQGTNYVDEWNLASKDAEHGTSYLAGQGGNKNYGASNFAWLHHGGRDSQDGPGVSIPPSALAASLTITHWYETEFGIDGGQVVLDSVDDGQDLYSPLVPAGGYPGLPLEYGGCNALEGSDVFQGDSGGWITSTFDLSAHIGRTVWPAFVFGSDNDKRGNGEGWYIDRVTIEIEEIGDPVCQITRRPGQIPATVRFEALIGGDIEASWGEACNIGEVPGQTYSVQAGDLATLNSASTYTHAPIGADCGRSSPATFTPGAVDEYYLVVPVFDGHEGDAGRDSSGIERPQPSVVCGERRVEVCP